MIYALLQDPMLLKGGLVVYESQTNGVIPSAIVFQYNPDQLSRTQEKRAVEKKGSASGAKEEALRAQGLPMENIKLTVQMNSADQGDQLGEPDGHATVVGKVMLPVLLTLQVLLYPRTEFRIFFGEYYVIRLST